MSGIFVCFAHVSLSVKAEFGQISVLSPPLIRDDVFFEQGS